MRRIGTVGLGVVFLAGAIAANAGAPQPGSLDRSFGDKGRTLTDFDRRKNLADDVVPLAKGKLIVVGETGGPRLMAVRYLADGSLDRRFGRRGITRVDRFGRGRLSRAGGALRLRNGKLIIAGDSSGNIVLVRLRRDGKVDRRFGRRGKVMYDIPFGLPRVEDVARQPDGKIVVTGYSDPATDDPEQLMLARFLRDGTLDESFGDDGVVLTTFAEDSFAIGYALAIQPDGKIVVAGEIGQSFIVGRFNSDGSPDSDFGNGAAHQHSAPFVSGLAFDVALLDDGRILAAGVTGDGGPGSDFALARLESDGDPDLSFGDDGGARTQFGKRRDDTGRALAVQVNGAIVVAGTAEFRDDPRFAIARYTPSGEPDPTFSSDGKRKLSFRRRRGPRRHDDLANAVALTRRGRIVVAGHSFRRGIEPKFRDFPWTGKDIAIARLFGR